MRYIIWIGALAFLAIMNSSAFAVDLVQREGNDIVVYRQTQVEVERYKDPPKEVPIEKAVEIMRKGEGKFLVAAPIDERYEFGIPFILKTDSGEQFAVYRNGAWSSRTESRRSSRPAPVVTAAILGFPVIALLAVSVAYRKTRGNILWLWVVYAMMGLCPAVVDRSAEVVNTLPLFSFASWIVVIVTFFGSIIGEGLSGFLSTGRSANLNAWRAIAFGSGLLIGAFSWATIGIPKDDLFIFRYSEFIAYACVVMFVCAIPLARWLPDMREDSPVPSPPVSAKAN